MTVYYEWDCETVADGDSSEYEDGEVIEHSHGTSYQEVLVWAAANKPDTGTRHAIVLVRDDDEGRSWAYVSDGKLPDRFTDANGTDAAKVPKRYHEELAKAQNENDKEAA
jgi:hypothetical protein